MRLVPSMGLLAAALALGACAEKAQTAGTQKTDTKPWEASQNAYVVQGWKGGDQASWEAQLRARAQAQNDYATPATK